MPSAKEVERMDDALYSAILYCARTPVKEAQQMRSDFLVRWRRRSLELGKREGDSCHVELLAELVADLGVVGADDLLENLRTACPMVGCVGYESLYPSAGPGVPELTTEQLLRRQSDVLARSAKAIRSDNPANKGAVWDSIQRELEAGYMVEVQVPPPNAVFLRRFVIRQVKADQEGCPVKLRPCDDGRMALVNKAVFTTTKVRLDTADMFAEVARLLAASSPDGSSFYSVGLDHKEAYRQLRARNDEVCRCVVAEDPNGAMRFFRMERLSFGEAAAVTHYNAFAKVLASVVRLGLKVPLCQYFDDFAAPCRSEDDKVLADVLELLQDILRTTFNPEKTTQGRAFRHLGLVFAVTAEAVSISLSGARKSGLVSRLKDVLARDSLAPGEAAALAGKLGFASTALYGKVGRVPLQPIFRRANSSSTFVGFKLGEPLEVALSWWVKVLEGDPSTFQRSVPVRAVQRGCAIRYVLLTDACLYGLGAVCIVLEDDRPVAVEYFSYAVPQGSGLPIHALEFAAVSVAFRLWFTGRKDYTVSVWVDNQTVLGNLVQGKSRTKQLLAPVHALWEFLAQARARVWFQWVPGDRNIADLPSRLEHRWSEVGFCGLRPRERVLEQGVVEREIANLLREERRFVRCASARLASA
ncbi:hypothetical protein DIPPA_21334 [Diplonema papillatum]|nr:hypothetical protein DIPPA_00439 [Diplonema papillatum]KAJ9456413.1 hypothetical protein DIPPA_21334 [Diplonema papillatum]